MSIWECAAAAARHAQQRLITPHAAFMCAPLLFTSIIKDMPLEGARKANKRAGGGRTVLRQQLFEESRRQPWAPFSTIGTRKPPYNAKEKSRFKDVDLGAMAAERPEEPGVKKWAACCVTPPAGSALVVLPGNALPALHLNNPVQAERQGDGRVFWRKQEKRHLLPLCRLAKKRRSNGPGDEGRRRLPTSLET